MKGRETEDPKFPKNPFPPSFLCKTCAYKNGEYDLNEISKFLVEYYSAIKPFNGWYYAQNLHDLDKINFFYK